MSVLVFIEQFEGKVKKNAWEAAAYASTLAASKGTEAVALVLGEVVADELAAIGKTGVKKVLHVNDARLNNMTSRAYTKCITEAATGQNADFVVISHSSAGKTIAPRVAVRMDASLIPAISSQPDENGCYTKAMFSGKAYGSIKAESGKVVVTINPNATSFTIGEGSADVKSLSIELGDGDFDYVVKEVINEAKDMVPLPEAEVVVSAGRGLKGPENWGMVEELAKELDATTACSRPVADIGWRPHHEHVGQTGIAIKPNLYIAIGISGAIQHLAGVNQSKCIVVINKDPEAPFFKAADYGIVGDAFEVVPKLIEAVRNSK